VENRGVHLLGQRPDFGDLRARRTRAFSKQSPSSISDAAVFFFLHSQGKVYWGALLLVINMLDGHSQVVLGGSDPGGSLQSPLLSAFDHPKQSFCTDPEGWGPLSPTGFHLTPCFIDVVVSVVAVWGMLSGAGALYLLLKKRIPQPVSKNWHFYTKLVC